MEQNSIIFKRRRMRGLLMNQYFGNDLNNTNKIKASTNALDIIAQTSPKEEKKDKSLWGWVKRQFSDSDENSDEQSNNNNNYYYQDNNRKNHKQYNTGESFSEKPNKRYITVDEYLSAGSVADGKVRQLDNKEFEENAQQTVQMFNEILDVVKQDLPKNYKIEITSGFRTPEEHQQIYNNEHGGQKAPQNSAHLEARALDVRDPNKYLRNAMMLPKNKQKIANIMKKYNASFETGTDNWFHGGINKTSGFAHGNQMWNYQDFLNNNYFI